MNSTNDHKDTRPDWLQSAVNELDDSVTDMSSVDINRLRTARQTAYRDAQSKNNSSWLERLGYWQSGLVIACTMVVVATVVLNLNSQDPNLEVDVSETSLPTKTKIGIEIMPLMTAQEELEFYESVDFLLWLEEKQGKS